jgi:choice-of-anchor B domain-containing protein
MTSLRTTHSPARSVSLARAAAAGAVLLAAAAGSAHDEDWRKLVDRIGAIEGPIFRLDPETAGASNRGAGFNNQGVTLLSQIPLNQFAGTQNFGNDCWGYTSPSGREYAIMGLERGFGFVEITTPTNPVIVATISGPQSDWHDVKVIGSYAYGVSEGGAGIQVMDLSQIDSGSVSLVRNWQANGHSSTHNIVSNPERGTLFICGANIGNGGLIRCDLSDPTRPTPFAGWTEMYVHDAQVVTWEGGALDGREIAFLCSGLDGGITQTGLRVVDITDPSSPQTLSTLFYPSAGYSHQAWLSSDRKYLYLNDELDEQGGLVSVTTTRIINVEDPANPFFVDTFTSGRPSIDHNLYTRDGLIFQANYRSGLRVFDGSDPTNPVEVGFFDTFPNSDSAQFNGAWSVYPYFDSGTVIVSDIERGLFVFEVDALSEPRLLLSPVGEVPDVLDPAGGQSLTVDVSAFNTDVDPASVELVLTDTNGVRTIAGVPQGGGAYTFVFPAVACGDASFVVNASSTGGQTSTLPASGAFGADVITELLVDFSDNFQSNQGWSIDASVGDGAWERGIPVDAGRGDPPADFDGSGRCFLTDNSAANGGNSDVDDGDTSITSPVLDLSGGARIEYAYWLNDTAGGSLNNDALTVEVSFNGGGSWIEVRRYETAQGAWREDTVEIDAGLGSANSRVRFTVSDFDPQNVVEAGVDAFRVTRVVCEDPQPECVADIAEPFGVLDLSDINAFVAGFITQDPVADLAEPFGVFDLADIGAFTQAFVAGCP